MDSSVLVEISEWKLEAKQEDTNRYFYHLNLVEKLLDGTRSYVIGRKGTGKTAVGEYLNKINEPNIFTKKLTFKNFPFNDLYALQNSSFNFPNQYITLWKYLIYTTVAKLMINNQNINLEIRNKLEEIYSADPGHSLPRSIKRWVSGGLSFKALGYGAGATAGVNYTDNTIPWIERVEILEDLIYNNIDKSSYLIIFDELDEDYKDVLNEEKHNEYTALLTGLFKAVQDIKSIFSSNMFSIKPIIFLRDDIYETLRDPDKNKWSDFLIEVNWNVQEIKNLIAFRISRALKSDGEILPFKEAWLKIFNNQTMSVGNRQHKKMTQFDYITRSSMLRPRDFVQFIKDCAKLTLKMELNKVTPDIVKLADLSFSNYLRSELEDEIHSILIEISKIFDIISHIRKDTIPISEFSKVYESQVKQGIISRQDMDFVLKILFHFSAIGNQPTQQNKQIFKYQFKEARFNMKESIVVHRGLYKALQLI